MKINFIRTLILSAILCAVTVSSAWSGLLGITPGVPNITFVNTNSAATSYSPATGLVTVTATPQLAMMISGSASVPVLPPRSLTIALQVDQSGNLVGGVAGDDLVLTGTVYGTSYAGTLLTGEIVGFGIQNSASTIDYIDLRLKVTGGSMASLFAGNDIGVSLAMENSTFSGSFDVSFQGAAKGNLGPIPPLQVCNGTIGDFIWNDTNRNGIQDAGETGIDNVSISLKDSSNTAVATKLSGPNGAYLFTGLCAGDYTVVVDTATLPAGFVASPILQGGDPVRDSNPNGAAVNLPSGTSSELTVDFGYNSPCSGSVGDLVWHDQNRNGIQDPGEPGLGTITVNLLDSLNNTLITSTTTDGSGKYLFSGLCAGNYRVEAVAPAGFVLSTPLQGGNIASDSNPNPSEVVLASDYSGEVTIDFGFNTPCTGSIGDFVWNDLNRNGIQNSDEPGINNIRVWLKDSFSNLVATATTTGNGFYQFGGLCAGTYRVEVDNSTLPAGMVVSPANATDGTEDSNNSPAAVILDADDSSDPTVDFGYYSPCSGSIGDMVWLDANRDGIQNFGETGINGVTVTLRDSANVVVAATTSGLGPLGQAGFYAFSGLCSGSYTVEVVTPAGLQISDSLQGGDPATDSNGSPASVYLDSDYSADPTIDFAFNPPCAGSIGNLVWDDLDRDGIQDSGEPGLDGVTVKLLTAANVQFALTTTAGGGLYRFDGLCAGDYRVEVVPPAGRTASPALAGLNRELDSNPNPFAVNLPADTSSDQSIDFGFNTPCSASIGNLVWHDKNRDGIQDELEPGISGASVKLKDASGTVIATTNTDQQGGYLFGGLCGGDYSVEVVTPAGFVPSPSSQGSNVALDSNGSPAQVNLTADDSSDKTIDFGFNTPCAAVIGDLVWNDLNQNGIQDSGEPGIAGVVVNLRDSQHTLLRTTSTKADGSYEFIGLCSGDYKIEALTPAGMTPTASEAAGDPEKDSNSNPATVTISSDAVSDTSIDFGFFKPCSAALGDLVWNDLNRNGIQDANEPGLAGAIVTLVGSNIYGMPVSKSFTTLASGAYQFTELCQGAYAISVSPPDGYTATMTGKGTPATDNNGSPFTVTVATDSSSDLTIDFGFFKPCSGTIGDFVWNDLNRNGVQDANEPGLAGVVVTLSGNDIYGMPVSVNFTTSASGEYLFDGLCQGTYSITAIAPDGYTAAPTGNGTPATDSNGNPANVELASDSSSDQTVDFGFSLPCTLCKDGVVYMTLKLEWRVSTGDPGERIRVRADSITGQILYDSWFDSISGNGIPVGTNFGFSVPASAKQVVVTVQGQYHPSETQKAAFSAECGLLVGQIDGNSYITFKVVDVRFDGENTCGTNPVIDIMKYASNDGKTWYRTDLDNVLKIALCPACEQDFDKDHCDYDHDGKCDEKDVDYCRNNKFGCDRHDSEHGSHKRKHRCDASTNKTYCEDRARESHGRDHADYNRDGKCDEIDVDYCRNNKAACDRHDAYHGSTGRVFRCDDSSSRNLCESRRQDEIKSDKGRSDYNRDGKCDEIDVDYCLNDRVACDQLDKERGNLKRRFRCDDSGNGAHCEDKAREEHDRDRADYDNDGKCDEKDMDYCRSNRAACDQHDRNHGNDRRKHRCDDSSDKGACEGRARQEHDRDRCDYNSDGKCDEKDIDHCESNKEICVKHDRDHLNCRRTFRCDDSYDKTACDAYAKRKHDKDHSDYNNDGRCDEKDVDYCKANPGRCDRHDNDHGLFRRIYRCDDSSSKDSCGYYALREHGRDSDDYNRDGKCDEGDISYCKSNPEECNKHDRGHGKLKRSFSCGDSANKTSCESTCVLEDRNDRDRSDYNRDGRCDERDADFCRNNPASCDRFDGERGNLKRNFRCDDSYNKVSCESRAQSEHDRDYSDYNRDGKCDEKDIDHCRNNPSDCDRHDRNRGGHGRSHRCDDSYDKTSCESRSREEHSRYEGCAGSGGTSASCGKVYYKFVVTDTGTTALNDIALVDSVHVTSSCAIPASLQPGGSFSCVIGPFQALAGQHSNTATASGTFMGVTATASDNAYYFGCSATVPKSPGYWKNHSEAWPVSSITIGGRNYTKSQAIALMNSSVCGDKTYTLFKALVAAKLNAMGCGDSSCVTQTIAKAEAWMALHNVGSGVTGDSVAWKEAEPLYLILDDYDNGKACGAVGSVGGCNQTPEPPAPSNPTCGACSGGVNRLTLMYKGWSTAMVTVKDSGGQTLYNAISAPNSSFSFTGKSSGGAMLQYVKIYVNGYHKATIYTDCSKSIYPGMGSGPFKVVEGYSLNGGKFCRIMSSACTSEDDHRHSKDYCDSHQGESSCTGFFNYNMDSGSRFGEIHLF